MILALLLVPKIAQATDVVYLLTAENINGTKGDYNNPPSNHTFTNLSGTVYTYTITSMPATGFSFRIGAQGWDNNMQRSTNDAALPINGDSYKITTDCYGSTNAWKVSYTEGEYKSLTITVDVSTSNRYVKITGVKNSTGGGASTTCTPGLYIAGDKYGKTGDQYIYKLQRNKDKQYYISLNAINGAEWSGVQSYSTGNGIDNYYISTIGQTYHLVYIDDQGKETDYYPSTNCYTLTGSDTNKGSDKTNDFSTTPTNNWKIGALNTNDANGGIYNFYVNTDVNGVPQNWYYEAVQTKVVAYEVNESTHTTDAYLYCTRANTTSAYNKNFFGMVSFVKDGYLSFLFADKTYGRRKTSTSTYDQDAAADSPNAFQFSKDRLDTGIYSTEFNPSRGDYIITGDKKPSRIFIIGSALNSNLSDIFTEWDPSNATEMVYDVDEGCYKATVTLNEGKQFRFLLDHNTTGAATSLSNNFGEDDNTPGNNGDTDYNNKVKVESSSTSGSNIIFNPATDTYVVRFYVERKADKQGFQWTNDYGIYRYTIEEPERLNATITPPTATVNYAASLTPKVGVVGTNADKRTYAFTIDGTDPTIDPATGKATGKTVVRDYTYDPVVPTNDVYTFYMSSTDQLTYIDVDADGKEHEHTLDGNTVTVKAQAVQTINEGSKYRLEGDIATGTYVFKTAGIKPTGSYTISVTNDDETYNKTGKASINKVTATVTVTNNETGKDDGVDVYYTIDGTDPVAVGNVNARLVNKDRKINVYGIVNLEHNAENRIRVAIAGSKETKEDDGTTHASCPFDLTCSTSEGGYINYRDGYTDPSLKTYGGDGHIVVYILPWSSNQTTYAQKPTNPTPKSVGNCTNFRVPFIYAYENIDKDGVVKSKALTHATHTIDVLLDEVFGLPTIEKEGSKCYWSYVDLVPDKNYKEVNIEMGYYDMITNELKLTPATIANVHNDMFLEFDVATGQIKDVTHKYTKDYFYTIGESGTKREAANPKANEHFFFVQVPEAWTINGNSVKVLQNGTELSGANVTVQGSAETSCLSKVCKIIVPATLAENTTLTIQPYNGNTASKQKLEVNYENGGYYFYESETHKTTVASLVFGADADDDKDQRPKGRRDVNHTLETQPAKRVAGTGYMGYGDYTYYLTPNWTYSSTTEKPTTDVDDNWNGKQATVNTIAKGTTISQTVEELPDGLYTVQMIVRGADKATATLQLVGSDYTVKGEKKGNSSASVSKTFAGYKTQGTVTTDGRVEYLLKTETKNGWQKLETVASVGSEGKLTISLKAEGGELQLSDVTLLRNANIPPDVLGVDDDGKPIYYIPTIWTTAPTGKDVTEYDLTARQSANAFSFFDRGDNRNAVIYADKNTVLGMSENTCNVAVPIYEDPEESPAKHRTVFRAEGHGESEPTYYEGKALVWEDEPDAWVNNNPWGTTVYTIWKGFRWNRKFLGTTTNGPGARNTIFLPFSMSEGQIKAIFGEGATVYSISSVNAPKLEVTGIQATRTNLETDEQETGTESNVPYILELPNAKEGVSYDGELDTEPSKNDNYSYATPIGDQDHPQGEFVGVYKYTNITSKSDGTYDYYGYDAERNGMFNFFSDQGADFKPFRAYLKIIKSAGSKPFYYFVVKDDEATGIEGVSATPLSEDAPVYNLQGQMIRQAGQHAPLPKGVYIQNGRKFVQQ